MSYIYLDSEILLNIYFGLSDEISRKSFASACKTFSVIAKRGNTAEKTYKLISENYELIKESSTFPELTFSFSRKCNVLLISEFHIRSLNSYGPGYHQKLNSQLVNLIWIKGMHALFSEVEDDSQIPEVYIEIKKEAKCWDLKKDWLDTSWYLLNFSCWICKEFVRYLKEEEFNFDMFLLCYQMQMRVLKSSTEESLDELCSAAKVEEICKSGKKAKTPAEKKELLVSLIEELILENNKKINYHIKKCQEQDELRDRSLVSHLLNAINEKKIPIGMGGESHIRSLGALYNIHKIKGIVCLALKPNNRVNESKKENLSLIDSVLNGIDSIADFWSEMTTLLRLIKDQKDQAASILLNHANLVEKLKDKIQYYNVDFENIFLWAEMPALILTYELLRLEQEKVSP